MCMLPVGGRTLQVFVAHNKKEPYVRYSAIRSFKCSIALLRSATGVNERRHEKLFNRRLGRCVFAIGMP